MTEEREKYEVVKVEMPEPEIVEAGLKKLQHYQAIVQKTLIKGMDYGVIPGTQKPTLLKPGAEKLAKIHGLADEYEILEKIEDWDKPFFHYLLKCKLRHMQSGVVISEGTGSCNSKENKYRWRWVKEKEIPNNLDPADLVRKTMRGQYGEYTQYRVENDDIFTQVNTLLKMAQKRAMVNAVLSACRLSAVFTQDMEDMIPPEKAIEKPDITPPLALKQPQKQAEMPLESKNTVKGIVQGMDIRNGEYVDAKTGKSKKWILYVITVGDLNYSTFDKKLAEIAVTAHKEKKPVIIEFEETEKGRNLTSITMEAEEGLQTKCNQCIEYARCEREPAIDCGFYVPLEETIPGAF